MKDKACTVEAVLPVVFHTCKLLSCLINIDSLHFWHGIIAIGLRMPVPWVERDRHVLRRDQCEIWRHSRTDSLLPLRDFLSLERRKCAMVESQRRWRSLAAMEEARITTAWGEYPKEPAWRADYWRGGSRAKGNCEGRIQNQVGFYWFELDTTSNRWRFMFLEHGFCCMEV